MEGPDTGYSWVVVVCCAFIHFAIFGIFRSAGVIYVAILQNYDVTREEASWPFALAAAVFQITSPVTSIITHYISQRKACMIGGIICTVGVAGCYFADSIMWINIFYGVIHGFGFGMLTTLLIVILNQYFVKYRATAIGFAFSGGSVSTLIFPLVMEWLLYNYNLKDSFLLLSGVIMNTIVASALLKAPPWMKKAKPKKNSIEKACEERDSGVSTSGGNETKHSTTATLIPLAPKAEPEDSEIDELDGNQNNSIKMLSHGNNLPDQDNAVLKEALPDGIKSLDTVGSNNDSVLFGGSYSKLNVISGTHEKPKNGEITKNIEEQTQLLDNKQIFVMKKKEKVYDEPILDTGIKHSLSTILRNPAFYKIAITMCVYFLGVHATFMVIVDFAKDKGIPEEKGVYIISMFSLTDLIGRAGLGWVTDRNYVQRKDVVCLSLAILGIIYHLYPVINELSGVLVLAAIQGLAVGCSITLFFVIQADNLGLKNLTLVIGLTNFITGISTLLRPSIIGLFRDVIGSYNWMFHAIGACNLIFALIWFIESCRTKEKYKKAICDEKDVI
ncbi:monocarboxylate transporter 13 isoform X1 [Parasteatoda tepidariorum]|uniref:monocarboxylate transporter 13 isoform X1 n=1 Tax=Parasteatoda tepidariorum TaxID=114398 RepID=UPI001C7205CA|nr:monocarboxylate transporter 13 isoform X2 [Parasteatoda tepidariorum]XP_042901304.1 monocarboxylate transporter 13 isoform X1 [Parasteatoda tepidariorum]XP_042901315.1 monocarboxylate transporter 13 isoform X3 [Parasteatoda tepidariorum]